MLLELLILLSLLLGTLGSFCFLAPDAFLIFGTFLLGHVAKVNNLLSLLTLFVRSLTTILTDVVNNILINLVELILVVETWIVEALAHKAVDENILQLLVDGVDIERTHLATIHRDDRTESYEVIDGLLIAKFLCLLLFTFLFLLLLCLSHRRELGSLCYNLQGTVRSKVKDIARGLHLAVRSLVW